jgi:hypothetical protein
LLDVTLPLSQTQTLFKQKMGNRDERRNFSLLLFINIKTTQKVNYFKLELIKKISTKNRQTLKISYKKGNR